MTMLYNAIYHMMTMLYIYMCMSYDVYVIYAICHMMTTGMLCMLFISYDEYVICYISYDYL